MRPVLLGSLRQHLDLHCVLRLCTTVYTAVRHCSYLQGLAAPLVPLRFRCPTLYLLPRRTCVPRDLSSTATSYSQQHYFFMRCPGRGLREMLSAETVRCSCTARRQVKPFIFDLFHYNQHPLYMAVASCMLQRLRLLSCASAGRGPQPRATSSEPAGLLEASKVRLEWKW